MKRTRPYLLALFCASLCGGFMHAGLQAAPSDNPLLEAESLIDQYTNQHPKGECKPAGLPVAPERRPTLDVVWSDGFENGGWTTSGCWAIGEQVTGGAHEGSQVAATVLDDVYPNSASDTLFSEEIDLSGYDSELALILSFWAWWEIEIWYDGWHVIYSADGGAWTMLEPAGGYPDQWGYSGWNSSWTQLTFNMFTCTGRPDQLSFAFVFHSVGSVVYAGVTLDEVQLETMEMSEVDPQLAAMPDYSTWINRETVVWGAFDFGECDEDGGDLTYTWDYGDGTVEEYTGPADYLDGSHAWASSGLKTCTITTEVGGTPYTTTTRVMVTLDIQPTRIAAAIDDGLRWLYLHQRDDGSWYDSGTDYKVGHTGLAVLAFEENSHFAFESFEDDIYAPTVQQGLDYMLSVAVRQDINEQAAGDPDINENGTGVHFGSQAYEHGIAVLALAASRLEDETVSVGNGAVDGELLADVIQDALDQIAWSQYDSTCWDQNKRGGWRYSVVSECSDADMSAVQWPLLGIVSAEQNLGLSVPEWVPTEAAYFVDYAQGTSGGWGYTGPDYWDNMAKTGAGIASNYYMGRGLSHQSNVDGFAFMTEHWDDPMDDYHGEHLNGNFYAMYGIKKGLEFYDVTEFSGIDWYQDYVEYLLYHGTYGQQVDGGWPYSGQGYINTQDGTTAVAVLVLTRGVVTLQPVAVITGPTSTPPDVPVAYYGEDSYHQDPTLLITSWLWDFDDSDGLDWDNPDAVGQNVTAPGYYLNPDSLHGTYRATLRVADNSDPQMTDTDVFTIMVDRENHPPIADPGGPYAAQPGETILLDASGSWDPDPGDYIDGYLWDTDGDGEYDDGEEAQVLWEAPEVEYNGMIGLRVYDSFGAVSDTTQPVTVTIWASTIDIDAELDISFPENPQPGDLIDICATITAFLEGDDSLAELLLRFFFGDPQADAVQIGEDILLTELLDGIAQVACVEDWELPDLGASSIWLVVDPNDEFFEYDEDNNSLAIPFGNLIGDLDEDWDVDFGDYTVFVDAWNRDDTALGDLGSMPSDNLFPPWSPDDYPFAPDGVIDAYDHTVMALMYAWNKYLDTGGQSGGLSGGPQPAVRFGEALADGNTVTLPIEVLDPAGMADCFFFDLALDREAFELLEAGGRGGLQVLSREIDEGWRLSLARIADSEEDPGLLLRLRHLNGRGGSVDLDAGQWNGVFSGSGELLISGSGVDLEATMLPEEFLLHPVHPNPFNPAATVTVDMPGDGRLTVEVFNIAGQRVASLASGVYDAGILQFSWDASAYSSGVYLVRANWQDQLRTVKAILVK